MSMLKRVLLRWVAHVRHLGGEHARADTTLRLIAHIYTHPRLIMMVMVEQTRYLTSFSDASVIC